MPSPRERQVADEPHFGDPRQPPKVDVSALEKALREIRDAEVHFDEANRSVYSMDASNYLQIPIGVVAPKTIDALIETVAICRRFAAPIVPRGGGTGLTGAAINAAVVLETSKFLNRVLEVDPQARWARVQPGVICDDLRDAVEDYGLTFGPDPSTHTHCLLGGMIGNNSCGMHAQMSGRVSENVIELDVLTYDGLRLKVGRTSPEELAEILRAGGRRAEIYRSLHVLATQYQDEIRQRIPHTERRVSGYNLDYLLPENGFDIARALVGTEGTAVVVLEAKVRLVYNPAKRTVVTVGFDDVFLAAEHVPQVLLTGPLGLEGMDHKLVEFVKTKGGKKAHELGLLPSGRAFLLAEYGGETQAEADAKAWRLIRELNAKGFARDRIKLYDKPEHEDTLWEIRESGLGATAFVPGRADTWEGWEDASVPPQNLAAYLRDFRKLLDRHGLDTAIYGHFGQGCVHCRIDFDLTDKKGIARYRRFVEDAADLVSRHGGSYSGEHGDGQSRGELWSKLFGEELVQAMREFKHIWDPGFKMNPGKLVGDPPYKMDDNLRLGPSYRRKGLRTHFRFPDDEGTFNHAALRCVGVGECRSTSGNYMCPSYRVTREEQHSTRGRAHILFDMVQGKLIQDGWKSEAVKGALDLCLSCKGCKGDCPVKVDIATLKAEFLSHYYEGRLRPRYAYAMGWIYWWARLASLAPTIANLFTQTPGLRSFAKHLAGIAPERPLPRFAKRPFRDWFASRPEKTTGAPVLLWPDTFTNYFHPEIGQATVEVLEDAGFRVQLPPRPLCCGRPLYDYGFLDQAKHQLRQILHSLREPIEQGVPLVGMEPSCLAVFRDELTNLFPDEPLAQKLKRQSFVLSEFLVQQAPDYPLPQLAGRAVIQGHCHQAATAGLDAEKKLLEKMGLQTKLLDAGCCGQAGSFGFEADKYELSKQIAEYEMAPQLRREAADTLVVANGFSCQLQIEHVVERSSLHLAQVIQRGLQRRRGGRALATKQKSTSPVPALIAAVAAGAVIGFLSQRKNESIRRY